MKRGDKFPVTIGGHVVAQAEIRELGDGTVTMVVPATLVTMATRTELEVNPTPSADESTQHIITGVDRTSNEEVTEVEKPVVDAAAPKEPASTTDVSTDSSGQSETETTGSTTSADAAEVGDVS